MTAPHEPSAAHGPERGAPDAPAPLVTARLLAATLTGLLALAAAAFAAGWWWRAPLLSLGEAFVSALGGPGVALGYFLPDAFTIPLPNDAVGLFGLAGGLTFGQVVLWGTLGSLVGGATGYGVGQLLGRLPAIRHGRGPRLSQMKRLVRDHGAKGLAAAALTPLPYSVTCWACGALGMAFAPFLAVSSLRLVRVAGYLYLVRAGFALAGP